MISRRVCSQPGPVCFASRPRPWARELTVRAEEREGGPTSRGETSRSENRKDTTIREPKDPSSYASIEDLRRELEEAKGQRAFTITNTINWLGRAANRGGASLAFKAYRFVVGGWQENVDSSEKNMNREVLEKIERETGSELIEQLQATLLIPRAAVVRLLLRCPSASNVAVQEMTKRLIELKMILPGSDVSRIVEYIPSAFLAKEVDWRATSEHVSATSALLREGLKGADVDSMFEEDPSVLFEDVESLRIGLKRLYELWPDLSAETLQRSEPQELALAVRALGLDGPPERV